MAEYNGAFSDVSAIDLGVHASVEALRRVADRAGGDRPRHLRERAPDLGRRHLRRPPRRAQGGRSQGGPGADGQPAVRVRFRVDRPGSASHPARRGDDGPRRRHGEHVAGAARDPRRPEGTAARPGPARRLAHGGAARLLLRPLHGADLRPRRGEVRRDAGGAGRVRALLAAARGGRVERVPPLRGGRAGRGQGGAQDRPGRAGRSPATGYDARGPRRAPAFLRQGRIRDRRQRVGHRRRRGGGGRHDAPPTRRPKAWRRSADSSPGPSSASSRS